jgi:hypothetical protein
MRRARDRAMRASGSIHWDECASAREDNTHDVFLGGPQRRVLVSFLVRHQAYTLFLIVKQL